MKKKNNKNEITLTIVGVGPGDPSLITIAGVEAIKKATLVAYPVSKEDGKSIAAEIASKFLKRKKKLPLVFPMVTEINTLHDAWENASCELVKALKANYQVALLSVGDVSLYSTSTYVMTYIKLNYPEYRINLIPGINSFSAAAAFGQYPLSFRKEQLLIAPVPDDAKEFNKILDDAISTERVIVFLKLGARWVWVKEILKDRGLLDRTLFAKRVGFYDQEVVLAQEVSGDSKPYFSLLIIRNSIPKIIN